MQPRSAGRAPGPAIPSSALAGAIDLGAVKARADAAARAADAPPPAAGSYVIDVTEDTFQAEVLDRSFQVPVLIDLWAEWCQPCKALSPVLERLANAGGGSWILAKVDVDANPRIQQALQVQSIPTIFAVIGGQLVPGFAGAIPEAQVREFIAAVLEAAERAGLSGPGEGAVVPEGYLQDEIEDPEPEPEPPGDPRLAIAEQYIEDGEFALAAAAYEAILAVEPNHADAGLALKQVHLLDRLSVLPEDAVEVADAAPDDIAAQLAAADLLLAGGEIAAALARLINAVRRTSGDERAEIRARLVEYFDLLGPEDPSVPQARRDLANALF
ncbi:MAG: co-chaperone YbbN [Pseudonocardiales bacterium]|nr:co-chaperone YbbN [Pseudonocardiales bacterium]